ncbi:hypothetical protein IMG5_095020 [Ichthyophthirius multifiliis]|uniref:Uncharacterized protein n=1 Tax=Ichthyophthirius multifiliis TaxID=5932 RepID=G0QRL6_ICHMU|nr:hypothetical protein IMG5_095020 [Ichthyophthirius multifiliis]EGR32137.1 hypothetical protein IMG5_095020 [Ichthyophthirius multifiliis]|eukprot:XP_004035623.1 hypothetical protein IMG5_095020 [Ichthyophthirius multifiliis]
MNNKLIQQGINLMEQHHFSLIKRFRLLFQINQKNQILNFFFQEEVMKIQNQVYFQKEIKQDFFVQIKYKKKGIGFKEFIEKNEYDVYIYDIADYLKTEDINIQV